MRLPKMSRKGKTIRNLFVVVLCLFCMAWMQEFPTRSHEVLLQRVAGAYLIEEPVELLYVYDGGNIPYVYGAVNGRLLRAGYEERTLGMQMVHSRLYSEEKRYVVHYDTVDYQKGADTYPLRFEGMLIGFLGDAVTAEMDFEIVFYSQTGREVSREIKTISGMREGEYNLRFPALKDGRDGKQATTALSALRLYDADRNLLEEKIYEVEDLFEEG